MIGTGLLPGGLLRLLGKLLRRLIKCLSRIAKTFRGLGMLLGGSLGLSLLSGLRSLRGLLASLLSLVRGLGHLSGLTIQLGQVLDRFCQRSSLRRL